MTKQFEKPIADSDLLQTISKLTHTIFVVVGVVANLRSQMQQQLFVNNEMNKINRKPSQLKHRANTDKKMQSLQFPSFIYLFIYLNKSR